MAKQTINIGTAPNDGTGTPLRTAFDYCNLNFTELYTAVGPSGNNIVVPGSATITGDLTANGGVNLANATAINFGGLLTIYSDTAAGLFIRGRTTGGTTFQTQDGTNPLLNITNAGVFTWYDGAGGTRMTLNSTGLGVGASPAVLLDIQSASAVIRATSSTGTNTSFAAFANTGGAVRVGAENSAGGGLFTGSSAYSAVLGTTGAYSAHIGTNGNVRLTVDSSGNVGIGVTPSAWLAAVKALDIGSQAMGIFSGGITHNAYFDNTDGRWEYKGNGAATYWNIQGGIHQWYVAASGIANNPITTFSSAAMTLDASGILMVGTTNSVIWNTTNTGCVVGGNAFQASRSDDVSLLLNRLGSNGKIALFARQGGEVGDISVTTTGTTFNSTSDYRLKEAVAPLSGGLARVNALKPSIYNWKSNGSTGEGFLAHELAEVVPAAVTGEKDAVNEDGSIKAQSIDMSRVVPILVAAIQELTAEVNALKKA